MRKGIGGIILGAAACAAVAALPAAAQNPLVESVKTGCEKELAAYCSKVTPGEGRVLACLYAYGDKLSGRCEYALFDAAAQLERAVAALSFVENECRDDLEKHCADVEAGEGRLLKCIQEHDAAVSARCKRAIKDVGLEARGG